MRPVFHERSEMKSDGRINPDELSESGQSNNQTVKCEALNVKLQPSLSLKIIEHNSCNNSHNSQHNKIAVPVVYLTEPSTRNDVRVRQGYQRTTMYEVRLTGKRVPKHIDMGKDVGGISKSRCVAGDQKILFNKIF